MDEQYLNKVLVTLPPRVDREARTAWTCIDRWVAWALPLPCSPAEEGGGSVWPFKECTSHGAMDGANSLFDNLGAGAVPRDYFRGQRPVAGV